jgi:hypothetical protein
MQAEEILDALEEYLGQYVGGTRGLAWQAPYKGDLFKLFLQAYKQGYDSLQALLRSPAVPFGTNSLHGISLRTPHRNRSNS